MGTTEICWATDSWNPITGCSHAGSPGCDHCYARRMAKRLAGRYGYPESPHEFDVVLHSSDVLDAPYHWRKPRVVFVCSMSDLFHEDIPGHWVSNVMLTISKCPQHIFLILTKRPERARNFFLYSVPGRPPDNTWLGVSVENQDRMWRLEQLFRIPAARYWVSLEPLLGPIVIPPELLAKLSGLVVGGESGPGARPMDPDWARDIRDACIKAGVAFTFKQQGGAGRDKGGRLLDGRIWDQWPWECL